MISQPIVVDGVAYPHLHVVSLKRTFEVLDGQNAGRNLAGLMIRDVIGTYYNYSIEIDADERYPEEYDNFYETVSSPSESHSIIVPYGQSTLEYTAYVTNGKDELQMMYETRNRWNTLSFNFIAMAPQRR